MARFDANENLPEPVVAELRRLGHDVVTMRETGHAGRAVPDTQVLELATTHGRAVVTLNRRHFVRLHLERVTHGRHRRVHVRPGLRGARSQNSRCGAVDAGVHGTVGACESPILSVTYRVTHVVGVGSGECAQMVGPRLQLLYTFGDVCVFSRR